MHSVKVINNVQIDHVPVQCYYPLFNEKFKTSTEFYRKFTFNEVTYTIGNFVLIDGEYDAKVAKIFCIFIDQTRRVKIAVRKYKFAKDFMELLLKGGSTRIYDSEVVEDFTTDYIVQADNIIKKCFVIFAEENENSDIIKESNLDSSAYFFCRYSLKGDELFPILSSTILTKNNLKSPLTKLHSPKKQEYTLESENINTDKVTSPNDQRKSIKISKIETVFSPIQRNSVKRNLNESFDTCPSETHNSVLNYSIVSDDDDENPLLLKLRISGNNEKPFVLLKKLNDTDSPKDKGKKASEIPLIRKSTRKIQRKSYAEYISPVKSRKRSNSYTVNENENSLEDVDIKYKKELPQKLATPKKEETTLEKRALKTPRRYRDDECWTPQSKISSQGSVRRSLRLQRSTTEGTEIEKTPQKRINLYESIRRSILKVRLNREDLEESESPSNNFKKRRHKSKCSDGYPDSSASDDDSSYCDSIVPSSPTTPKRRPRQSTVGFDVNSSTFKTPKTNRNVTPKNSMKQTPKTPKNRVKLIRDGVITPSMQSRSNTVTGDKTPLMKARNQLHVSYVPTALPCRDKEYDTIFNFVEDKLLDGCGGCIYISGVPGTGKTATVTSVITDLQRNVNVPKFVYVSINGMRLTDPKQSYVEILKQLSGKTVPWEQAQSMLEEKFTKSKKITPTVILVDELDVLYTKRQDVVYNLLDWPSKAKNQLIVITIANTMDLPERLLVNRVASRLGLTRLTFQAYTHIQLQEIVINRLSGTECFNPDAIQLVARKIASVSGDARRALDICRRAAEIAESESDDQLVTMGHVNKAVASMITQPKVRAIKSCSRLEQLILQSIVAEVERTGVEETTFFDVFKMLVSCAAIEGFKMVSTTNALLAVSQLSACRLVLTDPKCKGISQKLILNVSVDDVYYALKKDLA